MAEALFNYLSNGTIQAYSAGTKPASYVDHAVIGAMQEIGIDISAQRPKMLTPEMIDDADKVITMGCGIEAVCPATFVPTEDWELEDPEGQPIEKVREIREKIEEKVKNLIEGIQLNQ